MDSTQLLLLRKFIQSCVQENARAATQLVSPHKSDDDDLEEFSGVGAIAGFTAPLGATPNTVSVPSKKKKKKK